MKEVSKSSKTNVDNLLSPLLSGVLRGSNFYLRILTFYVELDSPNRWGMAPTGGKGPIIMMMRECHFVNDEPHLNNEQ